MQRIVFIVSILAAFIAAAPTRAAEKVTLGIVGAYNAFVWPAAISVAKGFYRDAGIEPDMIFISSSPALLAQVASGSLDVAASAGLVDPVRLVARKAGVAFGRIELRISPYVLISQAPYTTIASLKGKNVAIGSRSDITWILIKKMLASANLTTDDVEMMFSGSTASRFAAMKTGAFDATFLAPPLNYVSEQAGMHQLGVAGDYAKDLPFTGSMINRAWATAHPDQAKGFLAASDRASEWLHDPANRDEAIKILVDSSSGTVEDAQRSYDFLVRGDYFDRTHKLSRRGIAALVSAIKEFGDTDVNPTAEDCVVPGLTGISD